MPSVGLRGLMNGAMTSLKRGGVARETLWVAIGEAGAALGNLVAVKILATLLSPAQYGTVNLVTVGLILPTWILFAPIGQSAMRFYSAYRESGQLANLHRTCFRAYALASVFSLIGGTVATMLAARERISIDPFTTAFATVVLVAEGWRQYGVFVANAARDRSRVALHSLVNAWARPLLAAVFLRAFGESVAAVLGAYALVTVLALPNALRNPIREGKNPVSAGRPLRGRLLEYGLPFALWSAMAWVQQYFDRYAMELFGLAGDRLGAYVVASQVALVPFSLGMRVVSQVLEPIVYQKAGHAADPGRMGQARATTRLAVLSVATISVFVVLLFAVAGDTVIALLSREEYAVSSSMLIILAIAGAFQSCGQLFGVGILTEGKSRHLFIPIVGSGLLGSAATIALTRADPQWGPAWGKLASAMAYAGLAFWGARRAARA